MVALVVEEDGFVSPRERFVGEAREEEAGLGAATVVFVDVAVEAAVLWLLLVEVDGREGAEGFGRYVYWFGCLARAGRGTEEEEAAWPSLSRSGSGSGV